MSTYYLKLFCMKIIKCLLNISNLGRHKSYQSHIYTIGLIYALIYICFGCIPPDDAGALLSQNPYLS